MTLPSPVQARYDEAGVDTETLGFDVEHHERPDGTWSATVDLDVLLVLVLAVTKRETEGGGA